MGAKAREPWCTSVRVLVTGASGFIGRALAQALLRQGHEVVCAARGPPRMAGACEALPVDLARVPPAN
jgi:nucleoside-diphosphate-sugar epimerase